MIRLLPLLLLASVAPAAVHRDLVPSEGTSSAQTPREATAFVTATAAPVAVAQIAEAVPDFLSGQDQAAFNNWLARDPAVRAEVQGFEVYLRNEGLSGVLPTWQITRTASDYDKCAGPGFEVAPIEEWQHIGDTLRFIQKHVEPVIGDVEAKSGYRNPELNACAGGAKESAHRRFFALDLVPERPIARAALIRSICAIHGFRGQGYDIGLGFYNGLRFHIDSKGFRRWGPNGRGATSPCVTGV